MPKKSKSITFSLTHPASQHGEPVGLQGDVVLSRPRAIELFMEQHGITRDQLAEITGRSPATVRGWFSGRTIEPQAITALWQYQLRHP